MLDSGIVAEDVVSDCHVVASIIPDERGGNVPMSGSCNFGRSPLSGPLDGSFR